MARQGRERSRTSTKEEFGQGKGKKGSVCEMRSQRNTYYLYAGTSGYRARKAPAFRCLSELIQNEQKMQSKHVFAPTGLPSPLGETGRDQLAELLNCIPPTCDFFVLTSLHSCRLYNVIYRS